MNGIYSYSLVALMVFYINTHMHTHALTDTMVFSTGDGGGSGSGLLSLVLFPWRRQHIKC
jgi:hypothetical protein